MRISHLLFIFIVFKSFDVNGQIVLSENDKIISAKTSAIVFCIKDGQDISIEKYKSISSNDWGLLNKKKIALKNREQTIWLKMPLKELDRKTRWLCIKDPHINIVKVWILKDGNILKEFPVTGDHLPFDSRTTSSNNFVFPLQVENYDSCELVIAADKRHTKKMLSVFFYSDDKYFSQSQNTGLLNGILLGLSLILLIYNSYLFLIIKQKVFQWYSIYLFMIFLYFLSDMGYLFEFLYPKLPELNDMLRIIIISGSMIPFLLFINEMLQLKKHNPALYKINKSILFFFSLIFIIGNLSAATSSFPVQEFWLKFYRIISTIIMLIITAESFICMFKKTPFSKYTTLSLMSLLAMTVLYLSYENDWIQDNFLTENAIYLGISGEIMIMTFAIAARFDSFKKSSELLQKEKIRQQEEIINTITDYKEIEMQRLSNMLHDSVGARLSAIRLYLDSLASKNQSDAINMQIDFLAQDISALADEVRTFSHEISPLLLKKNGLVFTIEQLIKSINKTGKLNIQFENIGSLNQLSFSNEIMLYNILHELIQNIIKHSEADFCILQLMLEKEIISIFLEDNGIGFDQHKITEGLGFIQIRKLISFVDGVFLIDTSPGKGCKISIEFKNTDNE